MRMSVGTAIRNPQGFVAGKWRTLRMLLTDPERFYEEKGSSDRIWSEIQVLLLVGLAGTAGSYFVAREIMSNLYTGTIAVGSDAQYGVSSDVGLQVWGFAIRGLVGIFLLWIAFSAVLYVTSWLYSEYGSFFGIAKNTAWAFVPLFIGNLLKSITYVIASWNAWESGTVEVSEGDLVQGAQDVVALLYGQILDEPVAMAGVVISLVFIAWCGHIAAYGVADVRDIPVSTARTVAAIPTVGYLVYVLYDLATVAGVL